MNREGRNEKVQDKLQGAKKIFLKNGAEGLIRLLISTSYGYGDKFCAGDLNKISAEIKSKKPQKELWNLVRNFIQDWDMTL